MSTWLIILIIVYFGINIRMTAEFIKEREPWWWCLLAFFFGAPILIFFVGFLAISGWWSN